MSSLEAPQHPSSVLFSIAIKQLNERAHSPVEHIEYKIAGVLRRSIVEEAFAAAHAVWPRDGL